MCVGWAWFRYGNTVIVIVLQRLRESIKPMLKPHQLPPGHDVTKVRLDNL